MRKQSKFDHQRDDHLFWKFILVPGSARITQVSLKN